MSRDAFGPNLRRLRLRRGVSLGSIAETTKISTELLAGLERNDFSRWPNGIYARAYVRQYAYAIGVDPDATVDEFCRWFPQGDRRAYRTIREHAGIVKHELEWRDEAPDELQTGERRNRPAGLPVVSPDRRSEWSVTTFYHRVRRALIRA